MPNKLILEGKYDEAIAVCRNKLKRLSYDSYLKHWYYIQLSSAFYEKRNYRVALNWAKKAFNENPHCHLVLWHYAGVLSQLNKFEEAIEIYKKVIISKHSCKDDVIALKSDSRLRLALCYYEIGDFKNAKLWCRLFLRYYCKHGIEKKRDGVKLLNKIN